jgi:hypothetical protein
MQHWSLLAFDCAFFFAFFFRFCQSLTDVLLPAGHSPGVVSQTLFWVRCPHPTNHSVKDFQVGN